MEEVRSALTLKEKEVKDLASAIVMKDSFIKLKDSMITTKDKAAQESLAKIGGLERTILSLKSELETLKVTERVNTHEITRLKEQLEA